MRIYWTTIGEMSKTNPEIFKFDIKKEGMFIGAPGTLIFRTKKEALDAIENAKAWIIAQEKAKEGKNDNIIRTTAE